MPGKLTLLALFSFIFIFVLTPSCKKAVDKVQEKTAYDIITTGRWEITKMVVSGVTKTSEYSGFEFQFYKDGVVTAIKTGNPDVNGVWSVNLTTLSITSSFPVTTDPLGRFNGVWLITKISETSVQATRTEGGIEYLLEIRKK